MPVTSEFHRTACKWKPRAFIFEQPTVCSGGLSLDGFQLAVEQCERRPRLERQQDECWQACQGAGWAGARSNQRA